MAIKQANQNAPRASTLISQYQVLRGQRMNFETYWQSLHDYYYLEAQDINRSYYPGTELTHDYLYDSTTLESADVLASGFMNYLTPPTSKWFALRARNEGLRDNKRVSSFLEEVADQVNYSLNRSNFYDQMLMNYKSSGVYGTSCMLEEEDAKKDVRFRSLPIKSIVIVEDAMGNVNGYYLEYEFTAPQAEGLFGKEKLSQAMQNELNQPVQRHEKHQFLLYIAERFIRDVRKDNKENLPYEAVWIDITGKKTVEEGGYHELPAMCHRFNKRPFIPWGFSPAMKALPFARILNAVAKTNLRTMMKHTDPPVAVPDNAFMMPFNSNPRATNYYNRKNMPGGGKDIFAFGNFGDPNAGLTATEYYSNKVKALMYNDVFLAFEGLTKQMNNPEVMERINEKMALLGPAVGRYIAEMIHPVIIRTIGILHRKGKLPEPPDEFLMNPEFEIDSISKLAQSQRLSELNSLMTGLTLVGQMAQVTPDVVDKVNHDKVIDEAWQIIGAPMKVMREDEEVAAIRESKAAMAQQQMSMEQAQQGADVVKTGSEVDVNMAKARKEDK